MKKLLAMTAFLTMLTACDDGDVTVEEIDFTTAQAQRCGNLVYKVAGNEALIIELPQATAFANEPTPEGAPLEFEINTQNRVLYRSYSGEVSSTTLCGTIPPANPTVDEEWVATSGDIEIATVAVTVPNTELAGGEIIDKYRHTITFRNITFEKPSGSQLYETFPFGTLETDAATLPFNFDGSLLRCASDGAIFDFIGPEGILLNLAPEMLANEITAPGAPRTALIGTDSNQLVYRLYQSNAGLLNESYFCGTAPAQPALLEQWTGIPGVTGVSGIIQVTTTTNGSNFLHEITLINAYLSRGGSTFKLANAYVLGQIITTP